MKRDLTSMNLDKLIFPINIQLFAKNEDDEDEIVDGMDLEEDEEVEEDETEEELDIEEEEQQEEEKEEDTEEEEQQLTKVDKKTKALIRFKEEAKEAKKRIAELEKELQSREEQKKVSTRTKELIDEGFSKEDAENIAAKEVENQKLKEELANLRFEKLEDKYPGINSYKSEILKYKENFPELKEEEIYLAKFYNQSEFDKRTKLEQELSYKARQAKDKSLVDGVDTKDKVVKLSKQDEKIYNYMKKYNPGLTRKEYISLIEEDELS